MKGPLSQKEIEILLEQMSQDITFQDDPYFDENNELYDYETKQQELFDNDMFLDDTEEVA